MKSDLVRRTLTGAAITAAFLLVGHLSMARAAQSVAAALVGTDGQPISEGAVAVLDEMDRVLATGTTDDNGRVCFDDPTLAVGTAYRICARAADQSFGSCITMVASAADCSTALAALAAPVAAPAAGATMATEVLAIGVGAAAAAGGIAIGITETSGSGSTQAKPLAASRSQ